MRALVLEHGMSRAAVAAVRALRRGGWTIGVGAPSMRPLSGASRAVSRCHWVPTPVEGIEQFVAALAVAIAEGGYELVFGADDAEVLALAALRDRIGAIVPYAPYESVLKAVDKLELAGAADAAGVASPWTAAADEAALAAVAGPVVVKSRLHAMLAGGGLARHEASIEPDAAAAARRAREIRAGGGEPVLQELVEGCLMALVCLVGRDGELLSVVQQEADLTWPSRTGVTVRGRTVAAEPELVESVGRLLRELGWFGLAELQFIRPADGRPRLIDLNGRFYGSLALAVGAGPNLPAAWAALATGRELPELPEPTVGVRYHWIEGDLRRASHERRGGLVRDLAGCLGYSRGAVHSIWSLRDLGPGLRTVRVLGGRGLRKAQK